MIKQNKGIPVLAHPGLLKNRSVIYELIDYGIMGIEVIHKDHNQAQTAYYTKLAKDNNLLLTGGSDCHGKAPLLLGSFNIPLKYVDKLKEIKEAHEYKYSIQYHVYNKPFNIIIAISFYISAGILILMSNMK